MATTQTKVDPTNDDVRVAYRPVRRGPFQLTGEGFRDMWSRRRLARYLVQAEVTKRGSDTVLGNVWWVLDPLLQMVVYVVLVQFILGINKPDYPLFIFAAILPWKWFSTTLNDATLSVTGRQSLIRQIQFPKIVLPSASVIAGTWSFAFGLVALGIVYLFYLDRLTPWVLCIPLIAAVQFLFTMALGILLSSLNAFFRDIQNVLRHVLRLWFYLSPGLYSLNAIVKESPTIHAILKLNPFAVLFESYRAVIWGTQVSATEYLPPGPPDWLGLLVLSGISGLLLLFAVLIFKRAEPAFARIL